MSISINLSNTSEFVNFNQQVKEEFINLIHSKKNGFFCLEDSYKNLEDAKKILSNFKKKEFFIHIGIGGSCLGPKMLIEALAKDNKNNFKFIDNIDPDIINFQLKDIDINKTLFYIVSKSGDTLETLAILSIIVNKLKEQKIYESKWKNHLVFATNPNEGSLKDFSIKYNINCLDVSDNIGGRYSVLTSVGIFTALFAKLKVEDLLEGAKNFTNELSNKEHTLFKLASIIENLSKKGINQTVFMPYTSKLLSLSNWMVQLWAESLGKNNKSPTPIPAIGTTDQHSQLQLFLDGPKNKHIIFFSLEDFENDFDVEICNEKYPKHCSIKYLINTNLKVTHESLIKKSVPCCQININKLNEYSLGELIMLGQCLTVIVGLYLNTDPFGQPGVEMQKQRLIDILRQTN